MARILIIGYGNRFRSDDGLGWHAAKELERSLAFPNSEVEVIVRHQLTPELADNLNGATAVFFFDASCVGDPGSVNCRPVVLQPTFPQSHACSPEILLALTRQLHGETPQAFVVSVCGESFEHGEKLSPKVEASLPTLVALVERLAREVIAREAGADFV